MLIVVAPLLAACGSNGGPGPEPASCPYSGEIYEHGEEFDAPDGCLRYRCDGGLPVIVEDDRTTIDGDLNLSNQAAVYAQLCLGTVEGSLSISGDVVDFTPLSSLSRVAGTLDITGVDATTMGGLNNLAEVGQDIVVADNTNLMSLAFPQTMSAFGDVTIRNNDALTSLAGAEFIALCQGCAAAAEQEVRFRDQAPSGQGAGLADPGPSGGQFFGSVVIADNDALIDLTALGNLRSVWTDFRLQNNAALSRLELFNLAEIMGDFEVSGHGALATSDVEAFVVNLNVIGSTIVCGNLDGEACP
ncbi:MAG: hypothetical protein AAF721_25280 [Myxococcota bacterium]